MNRRDIVIGIVILAALVGLIYIRQKRQEEQNVPETLSIQDKIEDTFNLQIPEDVEKAELSDIGGGDASGIATRKYEEDKFSHTVLADLPDPEAGAHYGSWLVKGEEGEDDYSLIFTGRLRTAKGGYLLEFESGIDYSDHDQVLVTQEKVADNVPEKRILQGEF